MKKLNKKAQVFENIKGLGIGIAALAIILVVVFLIITEGRENAIDLSKTTIAQTNVSLTITENVSTTVNAGCINERDISITEMYNGTIQGAENIEIQSGNWTILNGNQVNISLTGMADLAAAINLSYSCTGMDAAYNATGTLRNATSDIPGWVPLIVIAVIGAILIGLVAAFRRR